MPIFNVPELFIANIYNIDIVFPTKTTGIGPCEWIDIIKNINIIIKSITVDDLACDKKMIDVLLQLSMVGIDDLHHLKASNLERSHDGDVSSIQCKITGYPSEINTQCIIKIYSLGEGLTPKIYHNPKYIVV